MNILHNLSCLALKGVAVAVGEVVGFKVVGEAGDALAGLLVKRFTDHSQRLTRALTHANDRAWKALEISLAGETWWQRCKVRLASAEEKGFRQQVQAFLDAASLGEVSAQGSELRLEALRQLQAARKAGVLLGGKLEPKQLARQAGAFARFADPTALVEAEWRIVEQMVDELRQRGYSALARLLQLRPPQGPPLLLVAARYFFRREIETDRELFQGIAFARLEELNAAQTSGFAALNEALEAHGRRLEELLDDVRAVVVETREDVLDIKEELQRQGRHMQELGQAVLKALQQHQLERRELHPGDSLSIRGYAERQMVKSLVARYRALPAQDRRRLPALLNAIGKLEVMAGEFEAAQRDFTEVVGLVAAAPARAEAYANAYQAALEQRDWPRALAALQEAATLDPEHFAPFPLSKFEPERILGAGGFGVAFLCRNRHSGSRVVIKTLRRDTLDRDLGEVFREAQVLEELDHPAIIRVRDCDFADTARTRPFVVMDYFPGRNLAEYVEQYGTLSVEELLPLAAQIAEGLHAAHARNILHRDVKPANLLVQRLPDEPSPGARDGWQVKLIDFGLAMRGQVLRNTVRNQGESTLTGSSVAGTLDYAAPEQMGRLKDVPVGPYSDVYGFGKTCCFALFQTPQPTFQHWQKLPPSLAELLGQCLAETPKDRPANFALVGQRLAQVSQQVLSARQPGKSVTRAVVPVVEEVLPVGGPARPPRSTRVRPVPPRAPRREEESQDKKQRDFHIYLWVGLLALLLVAGVIGLGVYAISSMLRSRGPVASSPDSSAIVTPLGWPQKTRPAAPSVPPVRQPAAKQPAEPLKAEELPVVLKEWKTADETRKMEIARRLAATPATEAFRAEVIGDLEALLGIRRKPGRSGNNEPSLGAASFSPQDPRAAALRALGQWGTTEHVPLLIDLVPNPSQDIRWAAMEALVELGDERGAKAIATRLGDIWDRQRGPVTQCLIALGPKAETAVIPYLDHSHHFTRREACKILKAIGTEKSIAPLEKVASGSDRIFAKDAKDALEAVRIRLQTQATKN